MVVTGLEQVISAKARKIVWSMIGTEGGRRHTSDAEDASTPSLLEHCMLVASCPNYPTGANTEVMAQRSWVLEKMSSIWKAFLRRMAPGSVF